MQYVRTPSVQPAAASRLAVMLGVPLIGRLRVGAVKC